MTEQACAFRLPDGVEIEVEDEHGGAVVMTNAHVRERPEKPSLGFLKKRKHEPTDYGNTRLEACYCVPRKPLGKIRLKTIQEELTVTPIQGGAPQQAKYAEPPQPFRMFSLTSNFLYVPRFYGLEVFGPPKITATSLGKPMAPGLACSIVLQAKRHQDKAYEACISGLRREPLHGGVLQLPCGFGKTETALKIAHTMGRRTLVLVNGNTVRDEWTRRIKLRMPEARVGMLQQEKAEIANTDFVIGMLHSVVSRRYAGMETFGMVILDEAHHLAARTFSQAMSRIPAKYVLALSATFRRSDGLGKVLHWLMGPPLFKIEREAAGAVVHQIEYSGGEFYRKKTLPNSHWGYAQAMKYISMDRERNALILNLVWYALTDKRRQVVLFSKLLEPLAAFEKALRALGLTSIGYYTGKTTAKQRKESRKKRVILSTVQMGKEGLDIPTLNTMVMVHPVADMEQISGRVMRTASQNTGPNDTRPPHPLIFDVVDNFVHYAGMSWRRNRQYKRLKYRVVRTDDSVVPDYAARRAVAKQLKQYKMPACAVRCVADLAYPPGGVLLDPLYESE